MTMTLPLDHVVILVADLEQAITGYTALGFTVQRGGTHAAGSTHNALAVYSEAGSDYMYISDRLQRKFQTAAKIAPQPAVRAATQPTRLGVIYYGSTAPAMDEALASLTDADIHLDALRIRAFPFPQSVKDFILAHDAVFVVEQNRDGQLRTLLVNELEIDPARLRKVLHFDGTPITARFIAAAITKQVHELAVSPVKA